MKHSILKSIAAGGLLLVLIAGGCDRDRSNPLDPQADLVEGRPATPLELSAQGGVGVIRLAWQPVIDPDLAGYAVLRSTLSNGAYTFIAGEGDSTAGITTGKTTWVDTIRGDNRTFFYRVAAVDTNGLRSELSGFVGATSLSDDRAPGAPSGVSAVALESAGEVVVRWSAPQTDVGGEPLSGLSGYVVLRSEGPGGAVPVDTLAAGVQEYRDTGLKSRTSYSYSVLAFDGSGNTSPASASVSVTSSGLSVPAGLRAAPGIGRIELSWDSGDESSLVGYDVYRSSTSDGTYERLPGAEGRSFTTGLTSYVDSNLTGGQRYYYKVRSVGESGGSSELSGFVGATSLGGRSGAGGSFGGVGGGFGVAGRGGGALERAADGRGGRAPFRTLGVRGASLGGPGGRGAGGHAGGRGAGVSGHGSEEPDELLVQRAGLRRVGQHESGERVGVGDVVGSFGAGGSAGGAGDRPDRAELGLGGRVVAGGLRRVSLVDVGRDV